MSLKSYIGCLICIGHIFSGLLIFSSIPTLMVQSLGRRGRG